MKYTTAVVQQFGKAENAYRTFKGNHATPGLSQIDFKRSVKYLGLDMDEAERVALWDEIRYIDDVYISQDAFREYIEGLAASLQLQRGQFGFNGVGKYRLDYDTKRSYSLYPDPVPRSDMAHKWLGHDLMWPYVEGQTGLGGDHRRVPHLPNMMRLLDGVVANVRPCTAISTSTLNMSLKASATAPGNFGFTAQPESALFVGDSPRVSIQPRNLTRTVSNAHIQTSSNPMRVCAPGSMPFGHTKTRLMVHSTDERKSKAKKTWAKHVEKNITTIRKSKRRPASASAMACSSHRRRSLGRV